MMSTSDSVNESGRRDECQSQTGGREGGRREQSVCRGLIGLNSRDDALLHSGALVSGRKTAIFHRRAEAAVPPLKLDLQKLFNLSCSC